MFFDEFDSSMNGEELGWLKMFLSVMQDGTFAFHGDVMQLGKSILIFAGGTKETFAEFVAPMGETGDAFERFRDLKGPDFKSRLRGYIDVAGINPRDALRQKDNVCLLRRGVIIRSIIERQYVELLDHNGQANIEEGVLRALLKVSRYTHGARSLVAIFDMSNLVGRRRFDRSMLPSENQLGMHLVRSDEHDGVAEFISLLSEDS